MSPLQKRINSILNGLYGHWLAERGNPMAVPMQVLQGGIALDIEAPQMSSPESTLIVLVHGLMGSESIWEYPDRSGENYATDLARMLPANALCLHYNTGRAIAVNGLELDIVMETLVAGWPVPVKRIILIGHSMGGLVMRSACHQAVLHGQTWVDLVTQCVYLGTPHDGSWLAKGAEKTAGLMRTMPRNYFRVLGQVVDQRGPGIENLSRNRASNDREHPLLDSAEHFAVSGNIGQGRFNPTSWLFGDGLVHASSARGDEGSEQQWTDEAAFEGVGHVRLAHHPAVCRKLEQWIT